MRWLDSITDSMDMNLSKLLEIVKAWCAAVHGVEPGEATGANPAAGKDSQLLSPPLASARDPGTSRFSGTGADLGAP